MNTDQLHDAASAALAYLNMQAMRYCDDAPSIVAEAAPIRTKLSVAVSLAEGKVVGGSIPDMELARRLLDSVTLAA